MRKWYFIAIAFLVIRVAAQDCQPSQNVKENYLFDAEILGLREIYADPLHEFSDSVWIPKKLSNKYLSLLSAINYIQSDLTKTIFDTYKIHILPKIDYNEISMIVDPTLPWVSKFLKDSLVSGNSKFDSIISNYNFRLSMNYYFHGEKVIRIKSPNVLNLNPIINLLTNMPGLSVVGGRNSTVMYDGDDIVVTYINDTAFVEFSKGWDKCSSGCSQKQYWKFGVFDCSSSFINTSGDIYNSNQEVSFPHLAIYPNPIDDYITIRSDKQITEIGIFNMLGKKIKSIIPHDTYIDLSFLKPDIYIIELMSKTDRMKIKAVKR